MPRHETRHPPPVAEDHYLFLLPGDALSQVGDELECLGGPERSWPETEVAVGQRDLDRSIVQG
jgi:hypothetical protein